MSVNLIIRGGICVTHRGKILEDIAIRDGIIVAIGDLSSVDAENSIDASGLHILPGIIDSEFHMRSEIKNDTAAAVIGGITSILCVSNLPIEGEGFYCDYAYFKNASLENIKYLSELEVEKGCAGINLTMAKTNGFSSIEDDRTLLEALKSGRRRVIIHAEDQSRLDMRKFHIKLNDVKSHTDWRDQKSSINATRRILAVARVAGRRVHLQHISTDREMAIIAANKDIATAAVSPNYLFLSGPDCYDHFYNYAKLDPPIRDEENRIGLWKALTNGIVDVLASAHNPIQLNEKEKKYPNCPSGAPSAQTMVPLMLNQVNKGVISIENLVDLTSTSPARIFNIANKGRIAVGYDADFAVVDLNKKWELDDDNVESSCGWDLHAGSSFTGQVVGTIIRGKKVVWASKFLGLPFGEVIKFQDTYKRYVSK